MRITNSMMVSQFLTDANGSLSRLSKYQQQADSTKRIASIADDPLGTVKSLKARNKLATMEQYQENIKSASSYLSEIESATDSLGELTKQAYESMVSAINDTKTQDQRDILAKEIENLRDEILAVANKTMGTSYMFGGYNFTGSTDGAAKTPPFSVTDHGDLIYNGVNLSSFSRLDEFKTQTNIMTDLKGKIEALTDKIGTDSPTDATLHDKFVPDLLGYLKDMQAAGNAALQMAKGGGVSETDMLDLQDVVKLTTTAYDALTQEYSKPLKNPDLDHKDDPSYNPKNEFNYKDPTDPTDPGVVQNILQKFKDRMNDTTVPPETKLENAINNATPALTPGAQDEFNAQKNMGSALQVGMSQTVDVTMNGIELLGSGRDNLYFVLDQCVSYLKGDLDQSQMPQMLERLQNKQSDLLKIQTGIGTNQNRLELLSNRYETSTLAYKKMQSDAEDADMAEAYMHLSTAKTAYEAALASGAKIIQTSLVDYLR